MNSLADGLRSKTTLIVVRHGQTDLNDKDRVRGWHDVPLNEEGLAQAEKLGQELKDEQIDVIATSDFQRAADTAKIISEYSGVPIIIVPQLRPWNVGEHTGKESKVVSPELAQHAAHAPDKPLPAGESFNEFKHRFLSGVQAVLQKYAGHNIAIVTHHRGDMLLAAWEKAGMPGNHEVHIETFLQWQKGIEPGTHRSVKLPQPSSAPPAAVAGALRESYAAP